MIDPTNFTTVKLDNGSCNTPKPIKFPINIEPEITECSAPQDIESSENKPYADVLDDIKKELYDSDENGIIEKEVHYKNEKINSEYLYNNLTGKKKAQIEYCC